VRGISEQSSAPLERDPQSNLNTELNHETREAIPRVMPDAGSSALL
jgi:hypothetical protein